ncbi:DNA-binding GntR family transcriptional regulator [Nocardioides salarius]|uniref:DNA-binding GntR family transcriptional regulator n=2 Tax=Nocardioides salarius TaxID=374513 RepID=A0ABS2MA41_9ACTN|nr:DNA-binding GntR family transcriptional regulator [Nocardioides salarius]
MTASSVTSLSADPPMMLACINSAVPTCDAVSRSGRYVVNILSEGQGDLAHQFATAARDKYRDVGVHLGLGGMPLLTEALAHVECEVEEKIVGGSHSIFLGRVVSASASAGQPLTYFRGGFGRFEFARDDDVYRRARRQVLARVYAADDVLVVGELALALGVDESAAFYALTRMAAEGLVRRDPERGYVITPFDVRASDQTFDARLLIELGVIDAVVGSVPAASLEDLRARFEAMAAQLVGDRFVDFDAYLDANYLFHEGLVGLAQNPLLTATFGGLSIKSVMTRSFGSTPVTSQRFVDVQRQLTECIERGDKPGAREAARGYCELAKQRVRDILSHTGGRI